MKLFSRKDGKKTEQQKTDERREEVLATGRKFKYPLQWTKHRVVINTILIGIITVVILITSGWLALYRFGMTDEMLYRITKILPVPVATIDGEKVLFSDYLMFYRSSIKSIEQQSGENGGESGLDSLRVNYKRTALSESEAYTYAMKLAKEQGITVTDEEVNAEFNRQLSIGGIERSEAGFLKIVEENFGLDRDEYYRMLTLSLIRTKVEIAIDETANSLATKVESMLATNGGNYTEVANALGSAIEYQETGGLVSGQNIDGGRASEAFKLEPGGQSGRFVSISGDGYYFVKLISKTESSVNFVSIKVPFTEFDSRLLALRAGGDIVEYVNITDNQ